MSESETLIVDCPRCGTRFRLRAEALGRHGRHLRCSRCGHRWFMAPPGAGEPAAPPLPEGLLAEMEREPLELIRPGRLALFGWLLVALLVLAVTGLVVGRNELVAVWPQLAPIYARLGLPLELEADLELRAIQVERAEEDGLPVLVVRGEVYNRAAAERLVPPVRVALLDSAGRELDFGLFPVASRVLPPGGVTRFEARLVDPPPAAVRYAVTLEATVDVVPRE